MNRTRLRSFALPAILGIALLAGTTGVASADCEGPTISHAGGDLAHGDVLTITGWAFGDNCYDTGPPPPGEDVLGRPLGGVEVYIEQGELRHLVAVGDASADYSWEVDVVIPEVLDLGEARVTVLAGGFPAFDVSERPLDITSGAVEGASVAVAGFGGVIDTDLPPMTAPPGIDWTPLAWLVGGLLVAAGTAVGASRRRSAQEPRE